jgi:hypothetical protein
MGAVMNEMRDRFCPEILAAEIISKGLAYICKIVAPQIRLFDWGSSTDEIALKIMEEAQADLWRQEHYKEGSK